MKRTRPAGAEATPIRGYAQQHTRTLLRRLAYQLNQTVRLTGEDSVHDLRVAIRRFTQCLRTFAQFFPKKEVRKIRHKLKTIMKAASAVRDHDVTLALMKDAGLSKKSKEAAEIDKQRKLAEKELTGAIGAVSRDNFSRKWRTKLDL
jgi:CHAD domain-containing protein